jgi:hypothetical protein
MHGVPTITVTVTVRAGYNTVVAVNIQLFGVCLGVFRTLILVGRVGTCSVLEMLIWLQCSQLLFLPQNGV